MISLRARTVAIIGAGPSGLVAAKYFRAEKAFDKIVVFEQRSRSGGIWNYTPDDQDEDLFTIPQTSPTGKNLDPVWREPVGHEPETNAQNGVMNEASFLSPIYDNLETNIPRGLMGFSDLDWPQDSQLFPQHQVVLEYINEYGRDVQDLVRYETQVVDVKAVDEEYAGGWVVRTRDLWSNEEQEEVFGAVIVANGHFIVPCVPDFPGIREWSQKFPGTITHAKYFRNTDEFVGKKVMVVGNSASGMDISSQIVTVCQQPLLWSSRSISMFKAPPLPGRRECPHIVKLLSDTRGVEFEDGTVETDIDAIVLATGYFYSLPFLENVKPALITDGSRVHHTYQYLFYAPRPTLSFLVLNQRAIPFAIAEAQSAVLARVYSDRLPLPSLTEMQKWEEKAIVENGGGKTFHLLQFPKDANYINAMSTWAMTAPPREGLDNDGKGKVPPVWGDWEFWCREYFPQIRGAFLRKGEERHGVRTLEQLGFSFEEYTEKRKREEGKLI